ncbi:hypothetical protein KAR91_57395 [Candidatus Pacearchaeota archaeon]|nr:hypothetical protein [Candidatus Pacearchaeota archaeon]
MSNATEKTAIANIGLFMVGESAITSITATKPDAVKINTIFESVVRELLAEDWYFSRKRVKFEDLVQVFKLTIDAAPTPAAWVVGGTITGGTSGFACTVVEVLSDTVYLVTEPTGTWTDGEILSDGTNSRDTGTGFPQDTDGLNHGKWQYGFKRPTDILWLLKTSGIDSDRVNFPYYPEGSVIYTNQLDAYIRYNKWIGYQGSATVSDVTQMRVWFHRLISARIAYILAPNVTENQRREQKIEIELNEAYLHAREKNGDESWYEDENNNDWAYGADNVLSGLCD